MEIADELCSALGIADVDARKKAVIALHSERLFPAMHILQWEVMPRDLIAETKVGTCVYMAGTAHKEVSGVLDDSNLNELAYGQWLDCGRSRHRGQSTTAIEASHNVLPAPGAEFWTSTFQARGEQFRRVLGRAVELNRTSYNDFLSDLKKDSSNTAEKDFVNVISESTLIHDGELTFFSLLWIFRYALSRFAEEDVFAWLQDTTRQLPLLFSPQGGDATDDWWVLTTADVLFLDLGLLCPIGIKDATTVSPQRDPTRTQARYLTTPRWTAMRDWLSLQKEVCLLARRAISQQGWLDSAGWLFPETVRQFSEAGQAPFLAAGTVPRPHNLDRTTLESILKPYWSILPVKEIDLGTLPDAESVAFLRWLYTLLCFFLSDDLSIWLDQTSDEHEFEGIGEFFHRAFSTLGVSSSKAFGLLLRGSTTSDSHTSLIDHVKKHGNHDILINRLAGPGFLPLEYLLRRGSPMPMHLLILPLDYSRDTKDDTVYFPTSLCFVTVGGPLSIEIARTFQLADFDVKLTPRGSKEAMHTLTWLQPYYTLLCRLSSTITVDVHRQQVQEESYARSLGDLLHRLPSTLGALRSELMELYPTIQIPVMFNSLYLWTSISKLRLGTTPELPQWGELEASFVLDSNWPKRLDQAIIEDLLRSIALPIAESRVLQSSTPRSESSPHWLFEQTVEPFVVYAIEEVRFVFAAVLIMLIEAFQHAWPKPGSSGHVSIQLSSTSIVVANSADPDSSANRRRGRGTEELESLNRWWRESHGPKFVLTPARELERNSRLWRARILRTHHV